jgi:hypothetical protein
MLTILYLISMAVRQLTEWGRFNISRFDYDFLVILVCLGFDQFNIKWLLEWIDNKINR